VPTKKALVIAVEDYQDPHIKPVTFAKADAEAFAAVLESHGLEKRDIWPLINQGATQGILRSKLRLFTASLDPEDTAFVFYAGHGFADQNKNYLTCHDSQVPDLVGTSISMQSVFDGLRKSAAKHVIMFFDSCHSGLVLDESMRGIYSDLSEEELDDFFSESKSRLCFTACRSDEVSRSNATLGHGIWTYHLIEAFAANAPEATEKASLITPTSLQNYLSSSVKRTLRRLYTTPVIQTPWLAGGLSRDFVIADVSPILEERRRVAAPRVRHLTRALFKHEVIATVKSLRGFRKGVHHVPQYASSSAHGFIHSIAEDELREDVDEVFRALRTHFKFKRKDLTLSPPEDGGASILTPDFDYHVSVRLDEDDLSQVVWCREVSNVRAPDVIESDSFNDVFDDKFDTIELRFDGVVDIEELITRMEDVLPDDVSLDYGTDDSYCELVPEHASYRIRIESKTLSVVRDHRTSPRQLLLDFQGFQKLLSGRELMKALPWGKAKGAS